MFQSVLSPPAALGETRLPLARVVHLVRQLARARWPGGVTGDSGIIGAL